MKSSLKPPVLNKELIEHKLSDVLEKLRKQNRMLSTKTIEGDNQEHDKEQKKQEKDKDIALDQLRYRYQDQQHQTTSLDIQQIAAIDNELNNCERKHYDQTENDNETKTICHHYRHTANYRYEKHRKDVRKQENYVKDLQCLKNRMLFRMLCLNMDSQNANCRKFAYS